MKHSFTFFLLLCSATGFGQFRIVQAEKLPLPPGILWTAPRFSPAGSHLYITSNGYDGIWEYDIAGGKLRQITADPRAGYGFALSSDGRRIAYRRVIFADGAQGRTQEIIELDLVSMRSRTLESGPAVPTPVFVGDQVVYSTEAGATSPGTIGAISPPVVLGVEKTKIAMVREGKKTLFDPFGDGRYIWPSLSPDGERILAYEMRRGTFVCDTDGTHLQRLGRRDAPVWTRDGRWIVFMESRDDGDRLISSEIACVAADGSSPVRLSAADGKIKIDPDCSPAEDTIAYATDDGSIWLMHYREEGR